MEIFTSNFLTDGTSVRSESHFCSPVFLHHHGACVWDSQWRMLKQ